MSTPAWVFENPQASARSGGRNKSNGAEDQNRYGNSDQIFNLAGGVPHYNVHGQLTTAKRNRGVRDKSVYLKDDRYYANGGSNLPLFPTQNMPSSRTMQDRKKKQPFFRVWAKFLGVIF